MACVCTHRGSARHGPLLAANSRVCAGDRRAAGERGGGVRAGGEG